MKEMIADLSPPERRIVGLGLLGLTPPLLAWTAASVWLTLAHMALAGEICGLATIHCGWCVSAVIGAAATLIVSGIGLRLMSDAAGANAVRA